VATRTPGWSQAREGVDDPEVWGEPRATRKPPTRKVVVVDLLAKSVKAVLETFESYTYNPQTDAVVEVEFDDVGVVDGLFRYLPHGTSVGEAERVILEVLWGVVG